MVTTVGGQVPAPPLLERERELAAVTATVDAAAAGRGAVLWVEGPAGIGKTRLLQAARDHALLHGVRVLRARGNELEREFAFGVVRGLYEPAVAAQPAVLLVGPARLASPVVTLTGPEGPAAVTGERLHGLYWLTVALADDGPLLLLIDDVHWADGPSLRALAYLARRIEELPVALVLASRPDLDDPAADSMRAEPRTEIVRPGALSREACADVVRAALGPAPEPAFLDACHDVTTGNPMLLTALVAALERDGAAPDATGIEVVRERAQSIVATFVLPRLRHLPHDAGAVARAVAVLGPAAELRRVAALAEIDVDRASAAVDGLVAADLLTPGRPPTFAHPLIADAVRERMSAAELHRGHRCAARWLAAEGADPESVAAHLLATERLADGWVVARLRAAAAAAATKGAPAAAVTYLRRAVDEPPEPEDLPAVLGELGTAQVRAARREGLDTLQEAWRRAPDPIAAGRIALALSHAVRSGASYRPADEMVRAAIKALGDTDPELVAELETELVLGGRIGPGRGWPSRARVEELAVRAETCHGPATCLLLRLAASGGLHDPSSTRQAAELAREAAASASGMLLAEGGSLYAAGTVLIATEQLDAALAAADRAIVAARQRGGLLDLGVASTLRAQVQYRRGRLADAEADARLADRMAAGYDPLVRRHTQAWLLHCLVERLDPAEVDGELARSGVSVSQSNLLVLRGRLRLARGRPDEALADFLACGERLARRGVLHPNVVPWREHAVLALHRMGRVDEAREHAAEALAAARRFSSRRAEGLALWVTGLVEGAVETLDQAVEVLGPVPAPLERARALVDLGAALRRANHRSDAQQRLTEGLQLAHECGAEVLAAQARVELAAAGVHARRPAVTGPRALTPTERRIADLAAGGASNREIAQSLFVTPKTVENHLGSAYRKLEVSGRAELRCALRE